MKKEEKKLTFDVVIQMTIEDYVFDYDFDVSQEEILRYGLYDSILRKCKKFDYYFLKREFDVYESFRKTKKLKYLRPDFLISIKLSRESLQLLNFEEFDDFEMYYDCLGEDLEYQCDSFSCGEIEEAFEGVCEYEK